MRPHVPGAALVAALLLGLGTTGCSEEKSRAAEPEPTGLSECREQWEDVAESVEGLDEDARPSALAPRWTSVLATVDYYVTSDTAEDCQQHIETQLEAITALRQFSTRVQPFDMEFQADQVAPDVGRYLADPLPAPVKGAKGKLVKPPTKEAVSQALDVLTDNAAAANSELAPGWGQLNALELTDETAVTTALQDLDFLAKDSPSWVTCNNALQVILAAVRAQKGLAPGAPLPTPTPVG